MIRTGVAKVDLYQRVNATSVIRHDVLIPTSRSAAEMIHHDYYMMADCDCQAFFNDMAWRSFTSYFSNAFFY